MLHELQAARSVSGFFVGITVTRGRSRMAVVRLVELFGAIGSIELMAFAGDAQHRNSQQQHGKKFHRAASLAARGGNATPKAEKEIGDGVI